MKVTIDTNYMRALFEVVPTEEIRTYLKGVHLPPDSEQLMASDGYRLLIVPVKLEDPLFNGLNHFCEGITFKLPARKPLKSDKYITIETGRNPERYEEMTWTYYGKNSMVREQCICHIQVGKFPDTDFIVNGYSNAKLPSIGFNPAYLLDVYAALGYFGGVRLLMGCDKHSAIKVDFGKQTKAKYYLMPMHL